MKKFNPYIVALLVFTSTSLPFIPATAGDVGPVKLNYVYQLDSPDSFDFRVLGRTTSCGSTLYRIQNTDAAVLDRKFSIAMSALLANKDVEFFEKDVCTGGRMLVGWIRIRE